MPKRTREHIIEEESRKYFEALLPNHWVVRKPDPDYAIDAEVEIFDKDGSPTGLIFLVQLKATDQNNISKALKLTFKTDTLRYYYMLELPVMLARYHSPTKSLYTRWAHSIDTYYSVPDAKSLTVYFSEGNQWGKETPKLVEKYLKQWRYLKKELPLPTHLSIHFDAHFSDINYPLKLESKLRELINAQSLPIRLTSADQTVLSIQLTIAPTELKVSILETKTFTMHDVQDQNGIYDEYRLPYDLLSLVGCSFFITGHKKIASRIFRENLPNSSLIESKGFLSQLGCFIYSNNDFFTAISLIENILSTDRSNKTAIAMNLFSLVFSPGDIRSVFPSDLQIKYSEVLLRFCNEMEADGDNEGASMMYYNLANSLRGSKFFSERQLFSWYKRAASLWKPYREREYYWSEIAGVLFNCNKYMCSSRFYKKALSINKKTMTLALCADALLLSGKYLESLEYFKEYLSKEKKHDHEMVLKASLLDYLVDFSGVEEQKRLKREAHQLASIGLEEALSTKAAALNNITLLEAICKKDLLCPMMWANLANLYNYVGEREKAFYAVLAVCLIEQHNMEAWLACILWGEVIQSPLVGMITVLAYEKNGEDLINFIINKIETQPSTISSKDSTKLKFLIDQIRDLHSANVRNSHSVIRLYNDENTYKEIMVNDIHRN